MSLNPESISQAPDSSTVSDSETVVDPWRVGSYAFIHVGCLLVLWVGGNWFVAGMAVVLYFVRMFAITAFYHRYFSHRAFKTSRFMQFCFAALGNTSMQRGALWWASSHRHHHNHSDEGEDRHSPVQGGFWHSHLGWLVNPDNLVTDYDKIRDFAKFPELVFLNKYDLVVPAVYGLGLWGFGVIIERFFPGLGTTAGQIFVWGFFISTTVLLHGTLFVNSLAHVWGNRRFNTSDDSRNNLFIALVTLGEGWHNNHHRYQHSARQGFFWFEIDICYYILWIMEKLKLISDLRPVPNRIYKEAAALKSGATVK